jgi:hypothetical protein
MGTRDSFVGAEAFVCLCSNIPTIYSFIDTSGDGAIQFDEWIVFVLRAKDPTFDDYAQLVIDLYDTDGR